MISGWLKPFKGHPVKNQRRVWLQVWLDLAAEKCQELGSSAAFWSTFHSVSFISPIYRSTWKSLRSSRPSLGNKIAFLILDLTLPHLTSSSLDGEGVSLSQKPQQMVSDVSLETRKMGGSKWLKTGPTPGAVSGVSPCPNIMTETEREVAATIIYCCIKNQQHSAAITVFPDSMGWNLDSYISLSWHRSWAAPF